MKTVSTKAIKRLVFQVLFSIGIKIDVGAYSIICNDSISMVFILYDRFGMTPKEIEDKFNDTVKFFIFKEDIVEIKCYEERYIVTTNYNIIESE